ncbi:hypothetical protein Ancab_032870 [Ancistrocladus abbreviatus]
MVSTTTVHLVVGILGNIIAILLYLSPVPTFVKICKKGSVEQYSAAPYLVTLFSCLIYLLYGSPFVTPNSVLLLSISAAGGLIEMVYLLVFVIYSTRKKRFQVIILSILEIVAVLVVAASVLCLVHTTKRRSQIVGILVVIIGTSMYAAPLAVMKQVIETRSVEYMPFLLSLASLASAAIWFVYAILAFDPYIATPTGLGSLFGLAQLILHAMYYKSTEEQRAARKAQKEMGLAQVVINGDSSKVNNVPRDGLVLQKD